MAQVIQKNTGADVFHIVVSDSYDPECDVMRGRAIEEMENGLSFRRIDQCHQERAWKEKGGSLNEG